MTQRYRLGIDLGGTKIEIVALDADGQERLRHRVPTPHGDYEGTLRAIAGLVADVERQPGRGPGRGHRGHRHARIAFARDRAAARIELRVPQRPARSSPISKRCSVARFG